MFIELVMPSSRLILCRSLLLPPQSFPASGSFPMSQFFASGGQSTGVSACLLGARYCMSNDEVGIPSPLSRMPTHHRLGGILVSRGLSCLPQHTGSEERARGSAYISQNLPPSPALVAGPFSPRGSLWTGSQHRKCLEPLGPKASSASFMLWFALL